MTRDSNGRFEPKPRLVEDPMVFRVNGYDDALPDGSVVLPGVYTDRESADAAGAEWVRSRNGDAGDPYDLDAVTGIFYFVISVHPDPDPGYEPVTSAEYEAEARAERAWSMSVIW